MSLPVLLLPLIPLMALLVWAAAVDLRSRRIPNVLTFTLVLTGLIQAILFGSPIGIGDALAGLGVGFALTFVLFVLGAMGGGDVKLLAGVGAWLGPWPALGVFAVAAILGMGIVLAQALATGRLGRLLRNTGIVTVNLVHVGDVGLDHARATGQECRSVDKPLPYAVPVLVATTLVVLWPLF